jgi:hypothetical protein
VIGAANGAAAVNGARWADVLTIEVDGKSIRVVVVNSSHCRTGDKARVGARLPKMMFWRIRPFSVDDRCRYSGWSFEVSGG